MGRWAREMRRLATPVRAQGGPAPSPSASPHRGRVTRGVHVAPDVLVPDVLAPALLPVPDSWGTQPLRVYRTMSFTGPSCRSLGRGMREEPPARPKRARVQKESLVYLRHREGE